MKILIKRSQADFTVWNIYFTNISNCNVLGRGLRFPCNDREDDVHKLFITWPFHYGPEPAIKNDNWPADNFIKRHLNELYT